LLGLLRAGIVELESAEAGREVAAKAKPAKPDKPAPPAEGVPSANSANKDRQEIERVFTELQKQNDWEALGLAPGADPKARKKAFREKTFQYHPDRHHRISDLVLEKKLSFIVTRLNEAFVNLSNEADKVAPKHVSGTAGSPPTESAADKEQERARALYLQGKRAYDRMDYWETIQFCREAIEIVNNRAEYFYLLARALARNANWRKEAAENLRNAVRLDPMNVEYLLALGEIYRREGLEVRARKTFELAKSIDPSCNIPEEG
ncbi:MAG: hypothetical protein ACRD1X_03380, partial [Vicinamibacteria bacterium]